MSTAAPVRPLPSLEEVSTPAELQDQLLHTIQLQRTELANHQAAALAVRIAAPQAAGQPYTVPADEFHKALQSMRTHYGEAAITATLNSGTAPVHTAVAMTAFKLPSTLMFHPLLKAVPPPAPPVPASAAAKQTAGDAAVDAMVAEIHNASLALIQKHTNELLVAAKDAEAKHLATAAWLKQMESSRASLKASVDVQLNAIFDKAAAVGKAHPDQRARVLAAANHGSALIHALFAGLAATTHVIGAAVGGAAHAVTSTVKAVGSWASGAVKSVGSFLHKLF